MQNARGLGKFFQKKSKRQNLPEKAGKNGQKGLKSPKKCVRMEKKGKPSKSRNRFQRKGNRYEKKSRYCYWILSESLWRYESD